MGADPEAGKLIINLPRLWEEANIEERRRFLIILPDDVYIDTKTNLGNL